MQSMPHITVYDIVSCLSNVLDLINPAVVNHHRQVAIISLLLANELGYSSQKQEELLYAALLHDAGAFEVRERLSLLRFETEHPHRHAIAGYHLLRSFKPFSPIASLIRFHHLSWNKGSGRESHGEPVPDGSHVLHLADRIAVLIGKRESILDRVDSICMTIRQQKNRMFQPTMVDAFLNLSKKEHFWLDAATSLEHVVSDSMLRSTSISLDDNTLIDLAHLFSMLIDFRSSFTATHSSGVAAVAVSIAALSGFSKNECMLMHIAGYLHDLGKLAVPAEILEKPRRLSKHETRIMRSHTYHGFHALHTIEEFKTINLWGSLHHERLDGTGYPFHYSATEIPYGSRIMAVADVFTALTENRPYRKGMKRDDTLKVMKRMADSQAIDSIIVSLIEHNYDTIDSVRSNSQNKIVDSYEQFTATLRKPFM